uniref:Rhodanese domain-containing protein n=1 Tax=Physcomitrium patens TaxID=3218 RepID=A0A7I4DUX8_PHYPA
MELQQLSSLGATSCARSLWSNGAQAAPGLNGTRASQRVLRVIAEVEEQAATSDKPTRSKGWFYDKFVAEQTMEAKLSKFQNDVKARNGYVGSWFEDSFKYTAWVQVHRVLTERGLQDVDCQEAYNRIKSAKAIAIDVREADDYANAHAEERNPDFVAAATEAVGGDKTKQVIVYCSIGGTLQTFVERKGPKAKKYNDPERLFGRQSRSLKAIYELQEAGFTNVVHMKEGLNQWRHLDLPLEAME